MHTRKQSKFRNNHRMNLFVLVILVTVARQSLWQPPTNTTHVTIHLYSKFRDNRPRTVTISVYFMAKMPVARLVLGSQHGSHPRLQNLTIPIFMPRIMIIAHPFGHFCHKNYLATEQLRNMRTKFQLYGSRDNRRTDRNK